MEPPRDASEVHRYHVVITAEPARAFYTALAQTLSDKPGPYHELYIAGKKSDKDGHLSEMTVVQTQPFSR